VLKLTRLKIDKYRRVTPGTEIVFDSGMNVLLGRNGTGKTTLLELISMCLRSYFANLEREEFSIEYDIEHANTPADCRRARLESTLGAECARGESLHDSFPGRRERAIGRTHAMVGVHRMGRLGAA
jgi:recombinational DNA repair ATPase RecF